jgi:hypothetical protein
MEGSARTTPVHLWIVGILSLLWNLIGVTDYVMTQTRNETWVAMMTAEQLAWFDAAPAWSQAAWALGVWGALLGSVLLLARSRYAVHAFGLSLAGLAGTTVYQWLIEPMPGEVDPLMAAFPVVIWAIAIALLVYALRLRRSGVLR